MATTCLKPPCCTKLQRRGKQLNYVHKPAGYEVGFLAQDVAGHETLIQVCCKPGGPAGLAREVRALQDAARLWHHAELPLITLGQPNSADVDPR